MENQFIRDIKRKAEEKKALVEAHSKNSHDFRDSGGFGGHSDYWDTNYWDDQYEDCSR
ncbi:MAG: hypothetical protein IJ270_03415 [Paludibacteraceae bacterium]|nr:hypothetical protein [Paludibacteraceae bacterium]